MVAGDHAAVRCARADADPIVAACLNSGTVTALALAFDCADQGSAFAEQLRKRLEDLLAEVSKPTTSQERRHLITGILAPPASAAADPHQRRYPYLHSPYHS